MVTYNLAHLTQATDQQVVGPIQDDEALLIYAAVKVMLCRRVLEIGGLGGYSARNFLAAVGSQGAVYTVDLKPVPVQGPNHRVIVKDAGMLTEADVDHKPLDLVFFDCHHLGAQMNLFFRLSKLSLINSSTVLVLHDTNLHPQKLSEGERKVSGGWEHQWVERQMVDDFRRLGYDAVSFHSELGRHSPQLPYRHGVTIMRKHRPLGITGAFRTIRHHATILLAKYKLRSLPDW